MSFEIAEITKMTDDLMERVRNKLEEAAAQSDTELDFSLLDEAQDAAEHNVKIAFVGQYSAGKSSIVKMLTGNDSIAIDAGITTQQSTVYRWNGIEIVDTPGIATGFRHDHDEIARKAIAQADLLIFVITNEGFDSLIVENFRSMAYEIPSERDGVNKGMGKLNEMLLVVNKMDRMGNTHENQELIYKDICGILSEGAVNMPDVCFLSAESYLDSIDESDEEMKQELRRRSGYDEFISRLNRFISEKGLSGRLILPVQQTEACLRDAVQNLSGSIDDPTAEAADTVLHKMLSDLRRAQRNGRRELEDIFSRYASEIRRYGSELANFVGDAEAVMPSQEEIEHRLQNISRKCHEDVKDKINEIIEELQIDFQETAESQLAAGLVRNVDFASPGQDTGALKNISDTVHNLGNIAKQINKDMILKLGHLFKYKFKPWQATKIIKVLDKWIPIIGSVIEIITELIDQHKVEQERQKMIAARRDIISSFSSAADNFEQDGIIFVRENFVGQLQDIIDERNKEAEELDALKKNKSVYVAELKQLIKECSDLQKHIRKISS